MTRKINFDRAIITLVSVTVVLTFLFTYASGLLPLESYSSASQKAYEKKLFGGDVITVDVIMDDSQWQELLNNALDEEYYVCDVVINGTTFSNVGIRAKGNTSLSMVTTDRYSFKIEFDHYDSSQSCWGLDKLVLNNNMSDATMMKEYFVYDMYKYLGASASLCSYADISINGERWGTYLALEAVEEAFIERNYGTDYGMLYKPDSMEMGDGGQNFKDVFDGLSQEELEKFQKPDMSFEDFDPFDGNAPDHTDGSDEAIDDAIENMGKRNMKMGGAFGGMGGNGSDLAYSDDDPESYSAIWESSKLGDVSDSDKERVIAALKNISEGNDIEQYLDVDAMLKYLAVHTFSVNLDSLTGNMTHNYYLRESGGKLSLIPWDYNLAFGGFQSGNASDVVNFPIDTPVSGVSLESRPIFAKLLENDEYLEKYHEYYEQLVEGYIYGGEFEQTYLSLRKKLDKRIASDPTSFYTYDEYLTAAEQFYELILMRAESIRGQLDGSIPSTTEGQRADSSKLIDASDIELSVLGSQMGGNMHDMKNGGGIEPPDMPTMPEAFDLNNMPPQDGFPESGRGDMKPPDNMGEMDMQPPDGYGNMISQPFERDGEPQFDDEEAPSMMDKEAMSSQNERFERPNVEKTRSSSASTQHSYANLIEIAICFVIMLVALIFAILYKNRRSMR